MSDRGSYPHDEEGRPMAIVTGGCTDTVPTVPYGSVKLFGSVTRPAPNTEEGALNTLRWCQRAAEYAVGMERRLLQAALDPSYKFVDPNLGQDSFAAPPNGYDPASMPPHPGDAKVPVDVTVDPGGSGS